jgi:hypothetical protein
MRKCSTEWKNVSNRNETFLHEEDEMDSKLIEDMFEAISKVVHAEGPYTDKVEAIKEAASSDDMTNLEELVSWFDEVEDDEEDE